MDIITDPDDLLRAVACSPPMTWQVSPAARITLDPSRAGEHMLAGATITARADSE